jgi:hypothetical protein
MKIFRIKGEDIRASSKEEAARIYAGTLKVEEIKEKRDPRLEELNLPEDFKDYIEEDTRELTKIYSPFLMVNVSGDREICLSSFTTEKNLEKVLKEQFADPDGSGWQVEYVIKGKKTYSVKAHVTIEYEEITRSLKEE